MKTSLSLHMVAAVCDRWHFPDESSPLGAHRAPLQGFCGGLRKCFQIVLAGLLGVGLLLPGLRAQEAGLLENPYAIVVARNVFGLNPPVVVDPNAVVVEPPVKIVPNGIMSIFGQLQVLFKVPAKPGGKDAAYILTEGQRQDEIEVVKINEQAGTVTFNNHGVMQELPLVLTPPTATPVAAAAGAKPGIPLPAAPAAPAASAAGGAGNNPFNNRFGNRGNTAGSAGGGGNAGVGNAVPTRSGNSSPQTQMTYEEEIIAMEVNRLLTQEKVNQGLMPPLPPTILTPPDATAAAGSPLIVPSPSSSAP